MELSDLMGNGGKQERKPAIEYTAQAASPIVSGEVKMTVGDDALTVAGLFDAAEIPFAEINALELADYTVMVRADSGDYAFSRMGSWCQPFYGALCDAYNKAVLRSLFIKGGAVLTAKGDYRFSEGEASGTAGGIAVHVYENNVTALPPDLSARRVPLCFVSAMDKGDYELALRLDTGESYTFSKLGYDTAVFAETVEKQIRKLREESLAAVREIDPSLTAAQASQIAKLMPRGAAAPIGRLAAAAPSFVASLEAKIAATRAAESYTAFRELCDPARIWVGFRKNETAKGVGGGIADMLGGGDISLEALSGGGEEPEAAAPDPYLLWLIAPSPDGRFAAVEFAEADSATFVYRTGGGFDGFARLINRALEAINFKREVIRLSEGELRANADYYMAAKRTAALRFVRANFAGRVIHSGAESWKRKLTETWTEQTAPAEPVPARQAKFCGQCSAELAPGVKFCGVCGAKA